MKELNQQELSSVSGGDMTAEDGIGGGLAGGLAGAGAAGVYIGLASNPAGWVVLGFIGTGALVGAAYNMVND